MFVGTTNTLCKIVYGGHDLGGIARLEVRLWSDSDRNRGRSTGP